MMAGMTSEIEELLPVKREAGARFHSSGMARVRGSVANPARSARAWFAILPGTSNDSAAQPPLPNE
jgi:hypothetical protein